MEYVFGLLSFFDILTRTNPYPIHMTPVRKYRKNYLPSEYQIPSTHLTFEIYDGYTIVHSTLYVQRTNPDATVLTLHGE